MKTSKKGLNLLATDIFNIKTVYINGVEASGEDCAALLNDLKACRAVLSGFSKTVDKLCLMTA